MIKKLYSFIKGLFVKKGKLEEQSEVLIDKSIKHTSSLIIDDKKNLHTIDKIEDKAKSQIDESEVVVENKKKEFKKVKNKIKSIKK